MAVPVEQHQWNPNTDNLDVEWANFSEAFGLMGSDNVAGTRFLLRAKLGQGTYGTVWRCFWIERQREVAVKFFFADEPDNEVYIRHKTGLDRSCGGASIYGVIYNSGTISKSKYAHVIEGCRVCVVMELFVGKSLASSGILDTIVLHEIVYFARDLIRSVLCLHSHGIAHLDIRPANIVIANSGPTGATRRLRLIDYGIACMYSIMGDAAPEDPEISCHMLWPSTRKWLLKPFHRYFPKLVQRNADGTIFEEEGRPTGALVSARDADVKGVNVFRNGARDMERIDSFMLAMTLLEILWRKPLDEIIPDAWAGVPLQGWSESFLLNGAIDVYLQEEENDDTAISMRAPLAELVKLIEALSFAQNVFVVAPPFMTAVDAWEQATIAAMYATTKPVLTAPPPPTAPPKLSSPPSLSRQAVGALDFTKLSPSPTQASLSSMIHNSAARTSPAFKASFNTPPAPPRGVFAKPKKPRRRQ
jgi:hypothetical protein